MAAPAAILGDAGRIIRQLGRGLAGDDLPAIAILFARTEDQHGGVERTLQAVAGALESVLVD